MLRYAIMMLWAGLAAVANAELVVEPDPLWMRVWKHTPHYFIGTYGIVAAIAIAAAAYWLIRHLKRGDRSVFFANAFLASLLAVVLANLTYSDITERTKVDTRAEEEAGRQRQREARANRALTIKDRVEEKRFAEDSEASLKELEKAGTKAEDGGAKATGEKAVSGAPGTPEPSAEIEPLYRKGGKKERSAAVAEKGVVDASAVTAKVKQESHWRFMLENDKYRSIFYGRLLLKLSGFMFWLTLVAVVLDYLLRFNLAFDYFLPLPVSLIRLDRLPEFLMLGPKVKGAEEGPKRMAIYCRGIAPESLARFLEDVILKGETFLYFGGSDPLAGRDIFHRFTFGTLHFLPVRKFVFSGRQTWNDGEFVLESAWFGRGCFVVEGLDLVERMARDMSEFLTFRQRSRAFAARTLHIVWDHPSPPPPRLARELLLRGGQVNIRTVVFSRDFPEGVARDVFKEAYGSFPEPRPYPSWPSYLLRGAPACVISWALAKCRRGIGGCWRAAMRLFGRALRRSDGVRSLDSGASPEKAEANKQLAQSLRKTAHWLNATVERRQRRAAGKRHAKEHPEARSLARPGEPGKLSRAFRTVGRAFGRFFALLASAARKVAAGVAVVLVAAGRGFGGVVAGGNKGVSRMLGRLSAWMKERGEKQAAGKARREEEAKRAAETRRQAEEKSRQAAAAKTAAAKEAATKAATAAKESAAKTESAAKESAEKAAVAAKESAEKEAAAKAALPGAGSLLKKDEAADALRAKLALQERLKAKQAERKEQLFGKKSSIAQMIKARQAAAQAKAAGSPIKGDEVKSADVASAAPAGSGSSAKAAPVSLPDQPAPQPPAVEKKSEALPETKAGPDTAAAEKQAKEKADIEARSRAEAEERLRKEREERQAKEKADADFRMRAAAEEEARRNREEAERQARAKAEEAAKKAKEQAEAAEKARLKREEDERQAREKAERETRERMEQESRLQVEAAEKARMDREETERQARVKAEEETKKAREQAAAAERDRLAREEAARQTEQKAGPEAQVGGKRIVVVRKPGQGPARPSAPAVAPRPQEQLPAAPVVPNSGEGGVAPRPVVVAPATPPAAPLHAPVPPPEPPPETVAEDVRFHCPHCGQKLAAPPQLIGRQVPCTQCGKAIMVPAPGGRPAPNAIPPSRSTIVAAPMAPSAAPQVRVSFAPPRPAAQPPGQIRPHVFGTPPQPQHSQQLRQDGEQFKFFCPLCGQKLAVKHEWAGRSLKCPACQKSVVIPSPG